MVSSMVENTHSSIKYNYIDNINNTNTSNNKGINKLKIIIICCINILSIILCLISIKILYNLFFFIKIKDKYTYYLLRNRYEIERKYFKNAYISEREYSCYGGYKVFNIYNIKAEIYYIYDRKSEGNVMENNILVVCKDTVNICNADNVVEYFKCRRKYNIIQELWRDECNLIFKNCYIFIMELIGMGDKYEFRENNDGFYSMGYISYCEEKRKAYFICEEYRSTNIGDINLLYDICLMVNNEQ